MTVADLERLEEEAVIEGAQSEVEFLFAVLDKVTEHVQTYGRGSRSPETTASRPQLVPLMPHAA